ncbi:universal stress protein [Actinoplanes sp. NPDC026623]|uniref:universal stress protein n=1 Tax=Actinoplanes sp. NPDC026623 TaxID=3155610 RepID=UPI0033C33E19
MSQNDRPCVVVGVDGSAPSGRALEWALSQAEATGAVVEAAIAWDVPAGLGFGPTVLDGEDLAGAAGRRWPRR